MGLDRVYYRQLTAAWLGWWVAYCHLKVRSYIFFDYVTYDFDPGY